MGCGSFFSTFMFNGYGQFMAHRPGVRIGPPVAGIAPPRHRGPALDFVDPARERLLLVSYAVYNIPRISKALVRAADRGASIRVVIEGPGQLEGRNTYTGKSRFIQPEYTVLEDRAHGHRGAPR